MIIVHRVSEAEAARQQLEYEKAVLAQAQPIADGKAYIASTTALTSTSQVRINEAQAAANEAAKVLNEQTAKVANAQKVVDALTILQEVSPTASPFVTPPIEYFDKAAYEYEHTLAAVLAQEAARAAVQAVTPAQAAAQAAVIIPPIVQAAISETSIAPVAVPAPVIGLPTDKTQSLISTILIVVVIIIIAKMVA